MEEGNYQRVFIKQINGNNICEENFNVTQICSALEYSFKFAPAAAVCSLL